MTVVVTPATGPISLPFSNVQLTQSINNLPTPFGQIEAAGYFPPEPLASQFVAIDIENGVISALPVTNDGPATVSRHEAVEERIFRIPVIEHQDDFLTKDIRNMLEIAGRTKKPATLVDLMNKRLMRLRTKYNITLELMKMSSLKGVIVDGAGTTIYDLFAAFEITKKVVYFDLSNDSADVSTACDLIFELIAQDLSDEIMTGIEMRCSSRFFTGLIKHPSVSKFYLSAEQALQLANIARGTDGGYRPREFTFGNVRFIEYPAVVPMWGGSTSRIIAQGLAHAYPTGTIDTHYTYLSPPDDLAEMDGEPPAATDMIHITTEPMKHGKGVEILGRAQPLPLWRRPKLLIECHDGSGSSTVPN